MNHIEMIASSLRNCSLNGGRGLRGRRASRHLQGHAEEGSDDSEGVTVELNSEVALPYHWQQCLDIRTGQVYYVNWADGTRTTVDPRTPPSQCFSTLSTPRSISSAASSSSFGSSYASPPSSVGTVAAAAEWFSSGATGGYGYGYGYEESDDEESSSSRSSSAISSALSSFSPTDESASSGSGSGSDNGHYTPGHGPGGHVLVAAGCRGCFMYFMVPKSAGLCPKCGSSGLVHLNNASYA